MSLAQILSIYINLNILIAFDFIAFFLFKWIFLKFKINISAASELKIHYFVIAFILFLVLIQPLFPHKEFFQPIMKVWSAESIQTFNENYTSLDKNGYVSVPILSNARTIQGTPIIITYLFILFSMVLLGGVKFFKDMFHLSRLKKQSYRIRKFGRVSIFVHDTLIIPFSYWFYGQSYVIVPSHFITRREIYKTAVLHELQHHRQNDTTWVYVLWFLRLFCILNPFIHLWNRWISEIQEFACDETLVNKNKVSFQTYARCLVNVVEIAQKEINQKNFPECATGLAFLIEHNLIKRRIEKMIQSKSIHSGRTVRLIVGSLVTGLIAVSAFASQNLVQDRRVTFSQANNMAKIAQSTTDFPIVVNDVVVKQLNKYIGTPEGREFMRNALQRMENYRTVVTTKLTEYHLPEELMAIPIVESGYQNLAQGSHSVGAGIWMFIESTARNFGLRVDKTIDERLNVDLLTDAAMRLLLSDRLRFNDWQLTLLAYNAGADKVQEGLDKVGSKDAWTLIRSGHEGDKDYLGSVMAAILIMKNPSSVQ